MQSRFVWNSLVVGVASVMEFSLFFPQGGKGGFLGRSERATLRPTLGKNDGEVSGARVPEPNTQERDAKKPITGCCVARDGCG